MAPRHGTLVRRISVIALSILCCVLVLLSEPTRQLKSDVEDDKQSDQSDAIQAVGQSEARVARLRSVCDDQPATAPPPGPGVETVLLPGQPPVTVCVPHKVGSHAWGKFSRRLTSLYPERMKRLESSSWTKRAAWVKKAVVVRHPLDRLVSAYRMIFQVHW